MLTGGSTVEGLIKDKKTTDDTGKCVNQNAGHEQGRLNWFENYKPGKKIK